MDEPTPASFSTYTSCPCVTSSCTPEGVMATRYSWFLTSRGIPTFTGIKSFVRERRTTALSAPSECSEAGVTGSSGAPGTRWVGVPAMKLYADRPTKVLAQLAGDIAVVILVFLAVRLGRGTHEKVAALAAPGRDAEDAARSTAGTMRDAAGSVGDTPLVGDTVAKPFTALAATSRQLAQSAQAYQDSVERLAVLSGILVAA